MKLDHDVLQSLPKVLLHEHLDGVLRPTTIIELAKSARYRELPTEDPEDLARWFHQGANQGSLPKYLEGFAHTIAVMQTEEALERVAYEQAEDLSGDGVVYFETRFAPVFHTREGLTHQQVVSAVLKGLERGQKEFGISPGLIMCAMRNMDVSLEMAELAVDFRERGVVGFDLAGEEGGFPPCRQWQSSEVGRPRAIRPRQKNSAGNLPAQQRTYRSCAQFGRTSVQDFLSGTISRDAEHRQPFNERHYNDQGVCSGQRRVWSFHRGLRKNHYQRDEKRVSALRPALWLNLFCNQAGILQDTQHPRIQLSRIWRVALGPNCRQLSNACGRSAKFPGASIRNPIVVLRTSFQIRVRYEARRTQQRPSSLYAFNGGSFSRNLAISAIN